MEYSGLICNLMLGDWLEYASDGTYIKGKVAKMFYDNNGREFIRIEHGPNYAEATQDLFIPILLTPEMLNDNGFVLENKNKYPRRYRLNLNNHHGDYIIVDFDCYNVQSKKNWSYPIKMCMLVGNDRCSESFVRVYNDDELYLHQLQHALRLAGIKKEIVL